MLLRTAIPEDAPQIAQVDVDTWRAAYRGILPDDYLAGLSYSSREALWAKILCEPLQRRFRLTLVAEDYFSGKVVGFASGGPERTGQRLYRGEVYTLYILPAYQRRGLGRRLVQKVAERLAYIGIHSMLIRVLAQNPARRFYESLGGREIFSLETRVGGRPFQEIAYGWENTRVLGYAQSPL